MELYPQVRSKIEVPAGFDRNLFWDYMVTQWGSLRVLTPWYFDKRVYAWFRVKRKNIEMLIKAFSVDYDPIENYDRIEDSEVHGTSHGTSGEKAWDSGSIVDNAQSDSNGTTRTTSRIHGNIGVTTATQMLANHVNFWANTDLYHEVGKMFISEFTIPIYS